MQRILDNIREKRRRKLALFRDLLTSRATPLALQHVQALNTIELEFFPRKKNTRVIDAWRTYADHLNQPRSQDQAAINVWDTRRQDLMTDLIYEMSQSLGYDFEKVMIKRDSYYPIGLNDIDNQSSALRQAAVKVFEGKEPLRVQIENPELPPAPPPPAQLPPVA
jgi:hypothetical protein